MHRRSFLLGATVLPWTLQSLQGAESSLIRVGVIGHTGRGNYGHGLDTVWLKIPGARVVGVADADAGGLAKAVTRLKADKGFTHYQEMLEVTRPEFVSVCPRHPDQHHDMILAAIRAGVRGIYVEKPFCRTLAEADAILAAAAAKEVRIAVAHRNRWHPALQVIEAFVKEGKLGKLLEIRGRGKGDRRGGDEDLWVLGSHVLNLAAYFAGNPVSCSALMLRDGRRVQASDVHDGAEGLGPLVANEVHARFFTERGITVTFDSMANDGTDGAGFGLQLVGSQGLIEIQVDRDPVAHWVPGNPYHPSSEPRPWIPITSAGVGEPESDKEGIQEVHNHVMAVRELVASVRAPGKSPQCDGIEARWTLEMIHGVFESHVQGGLEVKLPLERRDHPLARL